MLPHKTTAITVETARRVVIRRRQLLRAWCEQCGREVEMVGLDEAGAVFGIEPEMLRAHPAVRSWHVSEGDNGEFLVCLDSLLRSL